MAPCQPSEEGKQQQHDLGCFPSVLLPRAASSAPPAVPEVADLSSSSSVAAGRSATEVRALKVHSEAERRRRERINAHLSTLRRMIPEARQMDKASLLGRVIEQVKDLKRKANEVTEATSLPPETNEVSIECYTSNDRGAGGGHRSLYIRAYISCDDRPDLFAGFTQAFHGLRLRTIRADMTSLGGRMQHSFILHKEEGSASVCLRSLKESIKEALAKVASPEMMCSSSSQSKRHRLLESDYSVMSI